MRTVLLLVAMSICGCTTMHTVAPGDLQVALDNLQPGDHIAVLAGEAWQEKLTVVSVTRSSIQATRSGGERVTFGRSDVAEMQVRVRAPGRTAGLAAGVFFGVLGSGVPGLSL